MRSFDGLHQARGGRSLPRTCDPAGGESPARDHGEGSIMAETARVDWQAIAADPRFQQLHRKKSGFLWGLMIFSVLYYFLLPIGAAYFQQLFSIKVWGPVNVGLLFALSEFVVAWGIAFIYSRRANTVFDPMAADIVKDIEKRYGVKQ
jgi:uncharacterized membrane protein (DUF485 family)